ncbi:hypothetical protein AHiyo1_10110 [Arthrobacter sp. Hiyo1]|nr:hypothetical protein AHiyo1_10110 [Arthrobacter sp. Hiyo1]
MCASKPTGAYQIQTAPGVWRAPSQPNPRPFTSPAAASKPKDKPKVAVQQSILRPQPARAPAHSSPAKGKAIKVIGLMAIEAVISTIPNTGRFTEAKYSPATTSPSIKESLCALAMKLIRRTGLRTPSQSARSGFTPWSAARRGT